MKHAIIAIEDRRFYTNSGVDLRGIARAAVQDITAGEAVQGASTIPQQFVKISLAAENNRTVFQKLREAALAYHLTRRWSKDQILRNYLNRSTSATAPTASSRPRARTSPTTTTAAAGATAAAAAVRVGPAAARGRAAGRRWSPRRARTTRSMHPVAVQEAARPRAAAHVRAGLPHARRCTRARKAAGAADARRPDLPEGGHGVPVLHVLDQAAGRRPARRRPAGRAAAPSRAGCRSRRRSTRACRRRPRRRSRTGCRSRRRPARLARRDLQRATAWCARWSAATTTHVAPFNLATQGQRQPGSSFKPFVLAEALRAGRQPEVDVGRRRSGPTSSRAASASPSTTTRTPTPG